jgi:hypothetical protein
MAYDYGKAFALLDNPFSPLEPLKGLKKKNRQNDLASEPLLVDLEPVLEPLYSPDAGPFGTYVENFQKFARQNGYRDKPLPPKAGNSSFIFSIYGNEGTGKTTLAQVIISWLKQCKSREDHWSVYHEWSFTKLDDSVKEIERIDALQEQIQKDVTAESYCCIVVDNLRRGALTRALEMYDQLVTNWVVFLFLLSNDSELFDALSNNGKRTITPFRMRPLSANWAVGFVERRISEFRIKFSEQEVKPPWLNTYPLFPFVEADIRSAFDSNDVLGLLPRDGDTVSLRQFGGILKGILAERLEELDEDFDIMAVPEEQINKHLLSLSSAYKRLVENKRLVANG